MAWRSDLIPARPERRGTLGRSQPSPSARLCRPVEQFDHLASDKEPVATALHRLRENTTCDELLPLLALSHKIAQSTQNGAGTAGSLATLRPCWLSNRRDQVQSHIFDDLSPVGLEIPRHLVGTSVAGTTACSVCLAPAGGVGPGRLSMQRPGKQSTWRWRAVWCRTSAVALVVEPQQVVVGQAESGDGRHSSNTGMRSEPVIAAHAEGQLLGALS